ncbi:hypothetical protein OsJ_34452 [Oryza sativa Japonica Group]|uniref:Uncharacterized protein n=1 Tax=Oryza sativa subsp. japonica TaxID=39947 RepID=B9G8B0_ORYSJ|nr:hypothetical protein OsJ_34452 [Oryza sativa Japonica Group]
MAATGKSGGWASAMLSGMRLMTRSMLPLWSKASLRLQWGMRVPPELKAVLMDDDYHQAASSPGTSPPTHRTEEAVVGVRRRRRRRRRRRSPGLAAEAEQRALASGRDAAVLEFYSPRLRQCASLQGLVRELEDGAGGWTGFAIADAEDDRWLPECWGRGIAAHWVSAAGSVKPEPLEMGGGRQGGGEAQQRPSLAERMGGTQIKVVMEGKVKKEASLSSSHLYKGGQGCNGWVLIDSMVNTWWRTCVSNNPSLQFLDIVDRAKTTIDASKQRGETTRIDQMHGSIRLKTTSVFLESYRWHFNQKVQTVCAWWIMHT